MNRLQLIEAFATTAAAKNYPFATLAAEGVPTAADSLPKLLLEPPVFVAIEGRSAGKITYSVKLHLLLSGTNLPPANRHNVEDIAEAEMLDLLMQLSNNQSVIFVDEVRIGPSAIGSTVGCTATAKVVTEF